MDDDKIASPGDHTPSTHETPAGHARWEDRLVGCGSESEGSCEAVLSQSPPRLPWHPDLHDANFHVQLLAIPGKSPFAPVHSACFMLDLATRCNISVLAVAFGASYFQRVMEATYNKNVGRFLCGRGIQNGQGYLCGHAASEEDVQLLAVYAACVSLAAKNFDCGYFRPARQLYEMLRYVLSAPPPKSHPLELETRCMLLLEWRLGPRLLPLLPN